MITELSILIPVYNLDVRPLVTELHLQCQALPVKYEILLFDDASGEEFRKLNRELATLPNLTYKELPSNLGRSAIRNTLASAAAYQYLLMLDNDCLPSGKNFIADYVQAAAGEAVVAGGVTYETAEPAPVYRLHWRYGHRAAKPLAERQMAPYKNIYLSNVLVKKDLFLQYQLCESLKGYGHEDTLFALKLERQEVPVKHIQNTVVHLGLEPTTVFLSKTEQAVENLVKLYERGEPLDTLKLVKAYRFLKEKRLEKTFVSTFGRLRSFLLRNLSSASPGMLLFDLYRLYMFANKMQSRK